MFDDLLSGATLIGVGASFMAAVVSGLAPPTAASVRSSGPAGATPTVSSQAVRPAVTAGSMPIYDLPRVVVTGNRMRDGDILAEGQTSPIAPAAAR
jgi:hypothetical protein